VRQIDQEPDSEFEIFFTVDGNFAQQRFRDDANDYGRSSDDSSIRIKKSVVDSHQETAQKTSQSAQKQTSVETAEVDGCADGWLVTKESQKTAEKNNKKQLELFAETGIFVLVCRHGIVWKYLDIEGTFGEP
jgi:hypothetical protein